MRGSPFAIGATSGEWQSPKGGDCGTSKGERTNGWRSRSFESEVLGGWLRAWRAVERADGGGGSDGDADLAGSLQPADATRSRIGQFESVNDYSCSRRLPTRELPTLRLPGPTASAGSTHPDWVEDRVPSPGRRHRELLLLVGIVDAQAKRASGQAAHLRSFRGVCLCTVAI